MNKGQKNLTCGFPHWFNDLIIDHEDNSGYDDGTQAGLRNVGTIGHHESERLQKY